MYRTYIGLRLDGINSVHSEPYVGAIKGKRIGQMSTKKTKINCKIEFYDNKKAFNCADLCFPAF